jgi:hypothetical protein
MTRRATSKSDALRRTIESAEIALLGLKLATKAREAELIAVRERAVHDLWMLEATVVDSSIDKGDASNG